MKEIFYQVSSKCKSQRFINAGYHFRSEYVNMQYQNRKLLLLKDFEISRDFKNYIIGFILQGIQGT